MTEVEAETTTGISAEINRGVSQKLKQKENHLIQTASRLPWEVGTCLKQGSSWDFNRSPAKKTSAHKHCFYKHHFKLHVP